MLQQSSLQELTCYMGSRIVPCHLAEVTFSPLSQPIKADIQFCDPRRMRVDLVDWYTPR